MYFICWIVLPAGLWDGTMSLGNHHFMIGLGCNQTTPNAGEFANGTFLDTQWHSLASRLKGNYPCKFRECHSNGQLIPIYTNNNKFICFYRKWIMNGPFSSWVFSHCSVCVYWIQSYLCIKRLVRAIHWLWVSCYCSLCTLKFYARHTYMLNGITREKNIIVLLFASIKNCYIFFPRFLLSHKWGKYNRIFINYSWYI